MKTINEAATNYADSLRVSDCELSAKQLEKYATLDFKAGVAFAQKWIKIEDELPIAYKTGGWDGKRSDFVLAKNIHGTVFLARTYQGIMDGSKFCDFAERDDTILSHIVEWRPIDLS